MNKKSHPEAAEAETVDNSDPLSQARTQLDSVAGLVDLDSDLQELLASPARLVDMKIPVRMDSGEIRVFQGYRSQHSNARGPFKGGLRFHPEVSASEVQALSMWMSWKTAVMNLELGGGKGGVVVDPRDLSEGELERLTRGFARALAPVIGPDTDIPAPDVNTDGKIMGWLLDEYLKFTRQQVASQHDREESTRSENYLRGTFTGKKISDGGSEGRIEATGFGGGMVLEQLASKVGLDPANTTIAIQGFGNVAQYFALYVVERGYKVVAVSDSGGAVYNSDGLDVEAAIAHKKDADKLSGFSGAKSELTNDELLELDVDVLAPSALGGVIDSDNATEIKAKVILELANGPLTPEADEILATAKTLVVPDILANAGGVTVSYYERQQNLAGESWSKEDVLTKLEQAMNQAFSDVWDQYESLKNSQNSEAANSNANPSTTLRQAAYAVAVARVAKAERERIK